jgi:hypothetical protein
MSRKRIIEAIQASKKIQILNEINDKNKNKSKVFGLEYLYKKNPKFDQKYLN